jgi:hypothetical protein
MKCVYTAESIVQVTHVRNMLAAEGILAEIRNDRLGSVIGEIPFLETWPQLWVAVLDFERAQELIEQALHGPGLEEPPWTCRSCGEVIEGQFMECWNCGALRAPEAT